MLLASILFVVSTVAAQDPPAGREEFLRGQQAYEQGDYDTAVREWTRSYELSQQPLILYNLSLCYERMGRLGDAVEYLDRFLAGAPADDPNMASARARIGALRARLESTGIQIRGGPDGASIFVDDQEWGRTPRPDPIRVTPGSHRVRITAEGYQDFTSTVVVSAAQVAEIDVEMQEAPSTAGAVARDSSPVPWIVLGAGGVFVVVGGVLGFIALNKARDAPFDPSPQADSARTFALFADISLGLGIVGAGLGVLMLVLGGSDEEPTTALRMGPGSLSLQGRF